MGRTKNRDEEVAYHEAGHAVIHIAMSLPIRRVTIRPSQDYAGKVDPANHPRWFCSLMEHGDPWKQPQALVRCLKGICSTMAGSLAAKKFMGRSEKQYCGASDRRGVADYVSAVTRIDIGENDSTLLKERFALEHWLRLMTEHLLDKHWKAVKAVAKQLLGRRSLSGAEVREIATQADRWLLLCVKEPRMTREQRLDLKKMIAGNILSGCTETLRKENLEALSPSERRIYQEVQREIEAGKYILEPSGK